VVTHIMPVFKYVCFLLMTMSFGLNALGQELPPAANWVGLSMGQFEPKHFKEIGKAVKVDCKGKHLSRYGRNYSERDGKCYKWQRSEFTPLIGQTHKPSFCFLVLFRHEQLITSDEQTLLLLGSDDGKIIGVTHFPKIEADIVSNFIGARENKDEFNEAYKWHKFQYIYLIDCETRERLESKLVSD